MFHEFLRGRCGALGVALCVLAVGCQSQRTPPLRIAAAADLQHALPKLAERFEKRTGIAVSLSFGASGQISEQIKAGAPFDVFMAANDAFVRDLASEGLVSDETVQQYTRGSLVLAVYHKHEKLVKRLEDLARPEVKKIALANPATAPYGKAGKQALERAGLWEKVEPKIVIAASVGQALLYVENGDVEAALVGRAIAGVPEVRVVAIDPKLYDPIIQALGIVASSKRAADAERFAAFVLGDEGQSLLKEFGFQSASETSSPAER